MKTEYDKELCKKYPAIFCNRYADMSKTAMCWGFDCGDGWYLLINTLCANIQNHIDWQNREEKRVEQVVASQVKEKYGTLRFYYDGGDDYVRGLVSMAEAMSAQICEACGMPGENHSDGGWIRTLCQYHADIH